MNKNIIKIFNSTKGLTDVPLAHIALKMLNLDRQIEAMNIEVKYAVLPRRSKICINITIYTSPV